MKTDMIEELMICLKEQGYYVTIWGNICFNLHDIVLIEDIIDSQSTSKVIR